MGNLVLGQATDYEHLHTKKFADYKVTDFYHLKNSRLWNGHKHLPQNILHEIEYKHSNTDIINNDDTFQRALKIHKSHILAMGGSKFQPSGLA